MAGFAALFFEEADAFDDHAAIDGLAHVVDGEQGDAGSGEGLHLDAGAADRFGGGAAVDGVAGAVEAEFEADLGEDDGVAERDQVGGTFAGHDAGETGDAEDVAFLALAGFDHRQGVRLHEDASGRDGEAVGFRLGADVDHDGLAVGVEVCEGGHGAGTWGWGRYHSAMPIFRLNPARTLLALSLGGLLAAAPACAIDLPDLGEAARGSFSELQEAQLGREIMRQIRTDRAYLDDGEIEDYLGTLGDRLVAANPEPTRSFRFFGVSDPTINAFALPGGFIGVHTGLIAAARNESELAGVLAHEIAHVSQNHIARMVDSQKGSALVTLAALAVAILAARSDTNVSQAAIATAQAYSLQNQLDFTRENEREADRIGFQTLGNAGYSPAGMASFFERLQAQGRLYENNAPAYLRTHPLNHERIADMQNRIADMPYRQHQDSIEFDLVRAKVLAAEGDARSALARHAIDARARPADVGAHYAWAAAALRAGEIGVARQALAELDRLAKAPMIDSLAARILQRAGAGEQALARLRAALRTQGSSKPLAYAYAELLLDQAQAEAARTFLVERRRLWPEDARLFGLLARAQHSLGHRAEGHWAMAEAHLLNDSLAAAREQLELARRAGDGDFYTQSVIDARLRLVREREQLDGGRGKSP